MTRQWRDVMLKKLSVDWTREILYSLRSCVVLVLQSRTRFLCSEGYVGIFREGTRLAMPRTDLCAGYVVIEARFRGY